MQLTTSITKDQEVWPKPTIALNKIVPMEYSHKEPMET